jgi:DNA integrity scanning protein DisA with diadenylate cyclase activity
MNISLKSIKSNNVIIVLLFFCFGALFGFYTTEFSYFEFDKTISVENIFSILVTIFIGIYIASIIQHKQAAKESQKNIITTEISNIKDDIDELSKEIDQSNFKVKDINFRFKRINQKISTLEKYFETCKYTFAEIGIVKSVLLDNKQLITDNPLENLEFKVDVAIVSKVTNNFEKIKFEFFKIIFAISSK